jgi:Holliday junction resolvase
MSNKSKGSNAERELVSLFTENSWKALRVAGSGVNDDSPCDIIAGKLGKKPCAIEAKSSRQNRIYIKKQQIEDFILYSSMLGARPVLAIRFTYEGWLFLNPEHLEDSGKAWVISREKAKSQGLKFSQFFDS